MNAAEIVARADAGLNADPAPLLSVRNLQISVPTD